LLNLQLEIAALLSQIEEAKTEYQAVTNKSEVLKLVEQGPPALQSNISDLQKKINEERISLEKKETQLVETSSHFVHLKTTLEGISFVIANLEGPVRRFGDDTHLKGQLDEFYSSYFDLTKTNDPLQKA